MTAPVGTAGLLLVFVAWSVRAFQHAWPRPGPVGAVGRRGML
jgi:hypothetical protein